MGERNPKWVHNDYVKFMRFGQYRIERTGYGILGFITDNSYLDSPTFRGVRRSLMHTFDDLYILDLHGNAKKKETAPDGSKDENVFDITQGAAIAIFVRKPQHADTPSVRHAQLYGPRKGKYHWLAEHDVDSTRWHRLDPQGPAYLFVPHDVRRREEYESFWPMQKAVPVNVMGFQSHRDRFATDIDMDALRARMLEMRDSRLSDGAFAEKYGLQDNRDWALSKARRTLRRDPHWEALLVECLYRPLDRRACYFSEVAIDYPRRELVEHVLHRENLTLNLCRQTKAPVWNHAVIADAPTPAVFVELKDGSTVFPLYLYPNGMLLDDSPWPAGENGRRPNLSKEFVNGLAAAVGLRFHFDGPGDLKRTFGPEDVFHYAYAVFHCPAYRKRYAEFLKADFPRLPLTGNKRLFGSLARLGRQLVALHLLENVPKPAARYPIQGDNVVHRVEYKPPTAESPGRVCINDRQYFENVPPEVFAFHVGGYQVCEKWLKDRKGRSLSYDDIEHYRAITEALRRTLRLMDDIDRAIPGWPLA